MRRLPAEAPGLDVRHALLTPFLALAADDQIVEHLLAHQKRWGISHYVVRDIEGFAPGIDALRHEDRLP